MQLVDFKIGSNFNCDTKIWRCTDVGSRVIVAICLLPEALSDPTWQNGPPYALAEHVFDENDQKVCEQI